VGLLITWGSLAGWGATEAPTDRPAIEPTLAIPTPTKEPTLTNTPTTAPTEEPTPTIEPALAPGDAKTRPTDEMGMVYVPAGEFEMGSTEGDSDEQPVHTVALDGFWIDQTEVTNAQYVLCVADGGCDESAYADVDAYNGDDHPVVGVSWYDADSYCEWAGARLATEAEWEYAARGPERYTYPWGNDPPTCGLAQFRECSGRTVPAGSLLDGASWCDALDMAGNVWEWVANWYGEYSSTEQTNPTGPETGEIKVLRGGSFVNYESNVRAANRYNYYLGTRIDNLGFRCVGGAPGR